ncbi:MAG: type II secretion system F family protein [Microthrixaceae bacterium]|nr:type II secretion system F family protein [Microthrixaceae bacterium]
MAIIGLAVGLAALLLKRRSERRSEGSDPRRVLGSVAATLARGVSAGMTPAESLSAAADRFGGVVGEHLRAMRHLLARGVTLDQALLDWVDRTRECRAGPFTRQRHPDPDDVELLVSAIRFSEPQGAGLIEAFEGVAVALMDRAELDSEVRALTSQAWASVSVLCSLPAVGLVMVGAIAPSVLGVLVGTRLGVACLGVAVVLDAAAVCLARRLVAWVQR